jgi:predicted DNA-binding transcriptional regulator AlpA
MSQSVSERLLSTPQAAKRAGVSASSLEKRRVAGLPPRYIKLGSKVLYDPADLDSWLASCLRTSTSDPGREAAIRWAVDQTAGSPMSKWLLVVLANCADEDGSTIAGHAHLAALMEATPRTVLANMKLLEAEGFILRMRRNNVHGHRTSDRIQLLMPGRIAGHPTAQTKLKEPHLSVVQGALRGVAKVNDDASLGEAPSPYPKRSRAC